jgi:hypothetical protein
MDKMGAEVLVVPLPSYLVPIKYYCNVCNAYAGANASAGGGHSRLYGVCTCMYVCTYILYANAEMGHLDWKAESGKLQEAQMAEST